MNSERSENIEPACKFGPGGDFVFCWPAGSVAVSAPVIKVAKVEPTLFADDYPVRFRIHHHRPAHRIRSSVRSARKKHAYNLPSQGSLFESDLQEAKTA